MFLRAFAAIAALFLVSCGSARLPMPVIAPYHMEIQQGNYVSQEMVSQLKPGMSKDQVRFILGTPLIADSFHADRWDYVFRRLKSGSRELEHYRLAVFFTDDKLLRLDSSSVPAAGADVAAIKTPETKPAASAPKPEVTAPKLAAPAPKPEAPAPKLAAPAPKPEMPAPKPEMPAPKLAAAAPASATPAATPAVPAPKPAAPAPRPETPAPKPEVAALLPETPVALPQAQTQPVSGAESTPAAQTAAAGQPAAVPEKPAAAPEKPAAAPVPAGDKQPQEKKGWWDRLKEKVKF